MFEQLLKGKGASGKNAGAPPCGNNLLEACFQLWFADHKVYFCVYYYYYYTKYEKVSIQICLNGQA